MAMTCALLLGAACSSDKSTAKRCSTDDDCEGYTLCVYGECVNPEDLFGSDLGLFSGYEDNRRPSGSEPSSGSETGGPGSGEGIPSSGGSGGSFDGGLGGASGEGEGGSAGAESSGGSGGSGGRGGSGGSGGSSGSGGSGGFAGSAGQGGSDTNDDCGDGDIDQSIGEQCDGTNLGGENCQSLGFGPGILLCDLETCTYDTSMCLGPNDGGGYGDDAGQE
jgi:hypothetical protein